MAFLAASANVVSPGKVEHAKEVVVEIYDNVSYTLDSMAVSGGTLSITFPLRLAEVNRINAADDGALKFLGGLVSTKPANYPHFAQAMFQAVPVDGVLKYTPPSHKENYTAWPVTDGDTVHTCPPAWCMQAGGQNPVACEQTFRAFMDSAILGLGGWSRMPGTKLLQRVAAPPGRAPWTEYMRMKIALRGVSSPACADMVQRLSQSYPFMPVDTSLAYVPSGTSLSVSGGCNSPEAAQEALRQRDLRVWLATQASDPTLSPVQLPAAADTTPAFGPPNAAVPLQMAATPGALPQQVAAHTPASGLPPVQPKNATSPAETKIATSLQQMAAPPTRTEGPTAAQPLLATAHATTAGLSSPPTHPTTAQQVRRPLAPTAPKQPAAPSAGDATLASIQLDISKVMLHTILATHLATAREAYAEKSMQVRTARTPALFKELAMLQKKIGAAQEIAYAVSDASIPQTSSLSEPLIHIVNTCSEVWLKDAARDIIDDVLQKVDGIIKACNLPLNLADYTSIQPLPSADAKDIAALSANIQSRQDTMQDTKDFDLHALADAYGVLWARGMARQQEALQQAMQKEPMDAGDWENCASLATAAEALQSQDHGRMRGLENTAKNKADLRQCCEAMLDNLAAVDPSGDARLLRKEFCERGLASASEPANKKQRTL